MLVMKNLNKIIDLIEQQNLCLMAIKTKTCPACSPVIAETEKILTKYQNILGLVVTLEDTPEISSKYLVFTAPTIILLFRGKEVLRQSRFINFKQLNNDLDLWNQNFAYLDKDPFSCFY